MTSSRRALVIAIALLIFVAGNLSWSESLDSPTERSSTGRTQHVHDAADTVAAEVPDARFVETGVERTGRETTASTEASSSIYMTDSTLMELLPRLLPSTAAKSVLSMTR